MKQSKQRSDYNFQQIVVKYLQPNALYNVSYEQ